VEKYYDYGMNHKAYFPPGTDFDYSDVNYVLLAMIIEKVTGSSLQDAYKQRIFDRLNMDNSYLEFYEEARGTNPFSHAYFSTVDINVNVNTSFDWGGGGIVSTCEELNIFFRALLNGQLFKNRSTIMRMLKEADKGRGGQDYDYGLGIQKRQIHGLSFYGHGGAYDCDVFYCPERDISICMSLNQMNTHGKRDELLFKAIKLIM
jgi:D-alanyl-D-alanine carboxypeptidase